MPVNLVSAGGGTTTLTVASSASNYTVTLPAGTGTVAVNGVSSSIVSGTAQNSTAGTAIDFTGIPSWVKRITVMFNGVSTNGTSPVQIQLGASGSVQTTSYSAVSSVIQSTVSTSAYTSGFGILATGATVARSGAITLSLLNASGEWVASGVIYATNSDASVPVSGYKNLSAVLDRVRITTVNGTDTFDAGTINILYE